ncbi:MULTISPECIES: EAL domain-containing protein [Caballeronia]|jgi:EAL and modified HD-GYP domain-containing signal transduction protein|uniref:EAL and HDOD domain-containing protein n=1 Tax=Caballeronia TaxID=1827195 RepID=UPI00025BADEF|nr:MULTISPECIES: EAL domain-containing protein [Caballeronia]EKS72934.1 diguanylate phosphodiesterase [Burkholderia sp. SJ98]MDR5765605.1 EAL domain-containing protein [Caballeronia sp. LZ028]MDR5786928.1 EAL domain-containing protein [Caballeronia sp. LP003]MDR5793455.1 EAL domain-containing protein [Caballeronia sp. LZ008]
MPDSSLKRAASARRGQSVYVGRQPILDGEGALVAYELLFRDSPDNRARIHDDVQATAHVVARTIGEMGVPAVLGPHPGYVNMNRELLFDDIVHIMQPERFVLELLESITFDESLFKRCAQLRNAGFRFALDDVVKLDDALHAALPTVDIVKVDFLAADDRHLPLLAAEVKRRGKLLVAEKIETFDDLTRAKRLGFDLFQGYFFARPQVLSARRESPARGSLLRLMAVLAGEPGLRELEAELKRNPDIVVQLMRLANSSAQTRGRRVSSLREAIAATGTRQLMRWAQLLLYADGSGLPWRSDPLLQLVGTRARFLELAAEKLRPADEAFSDAAFMTGIFSLVHVVLNMQPVEILDKLHLAAEIRTAILAGEGLLGALLGIARAAERGDAPAIDASRHAQPSLDVLTPAVLAKLQFEAAAWFAQHRMDQGEDDA